MKDCQKESMKGNKSYKIMEMIEKKLMKKGSNGKKSMAKMGKK